MILKLLYVIYSKSAKITLSVCTAVGKFVSDVIGGKPVRSFFVYVQNCRLLNLSWFILERSHVFSLRAVEKDLSPAALVAGFTRISLHNVITSFIISRSGLGSSLIFTMMSSKKNHHPLAALVKFPSGRLTLKY